MYTVHIGGDDGGNDGGAIGGPEPMQMQTWVDEHCTVARSALRLRSPPETEQPGGTAKLYPILKRPRSPCAGWPQAASTATQQQSALRYPRPLPKQERPRTSQRCNGNSAWTRRRRRQQQRRWRWAPAPLAPGRQQSEGGTKMPLTQLPERRSDLFWPLKLHHAPNCLPKSSTTSHVGSHLLPPCRMQLLRQDGQQTRGPARNTTGVVLASR